LSFLLLRLFSWAIARSFGVPWWFTRPMIVSTCLRGVTKNSSFLRFRAVFVSYCPLFWGSMEMYKEYDGLYIFKRHDKKLVIFAFYGHFHELLPTVLGFRSDLQRPWHWVHVCEAWPKTRRFCILGPFSWAIAHCFGVPEWFTRSMTLSTCLRGMTKNTSFLCFKAIFMSYCPQFWGSVVIYKVHDTQYMFERRDKKLIVFAF
jgi:hypothetical protein